MKSIFLRFADLFGNTTSTCNTERKNRNFFCRRLKIPGVLGSHRDCHTDVLSDSYQDEALKTASGCPVIGHKYVYALLGIFGELGEVIEKLEGYVFEDDDYCLDLDGLIKEIGDVLWYSAVASYFLDARFSDVLRADSLLDFQRTSVTDSPVLSPGLSPRLLAARCLSRLVISTCKLSERTKKISRDREGDFYGDRRGILLSINLIVADLAVLADIFGVNFAQVAQSNIEKLRSRWERNAIKGNGDNR